MENRNRGLLTAVALVVAVLAFGKMPSGPRSEPKPPPTKTSNRTPAKTSGAHAQACMDAMSLVREVGGLIARHEFAIDSFIATVPDPIDSQVGCLFDSQLESIERAVEQ